MAATGRAGSALLMMAAMRAVVREAVGAGVGTAAVTHGDGQVGLLVMDW